MVGPITSFPHAGVELVVLVGKVAAEGQAHVADPAAEGQAENLVGRQFLAEYRVDFLGRAAAALGRFIALREVEEDIDVDEVLAIGPAAHMLALQDDLLDIGRVGRFGIGGAIAEADESVAPLDDVRLCCAGRAEQRRAGQGQAGHSPPHPGLQFFTRPHLNHSLPAVCTFIGSDPFPRGPAICRAPGKGMSGGRILTDRSALSKKLPSD